MRKIYRFFGKSRRLPIAWLLLSRHPFHLFTSVLGVTIAAVLVLMQLSIQDALYTSAVAVFTKLDAQAILIQKGTSSLLTLTPFSESSLSSAYASRDVSEVRPFKIQTIPWRIPGTPVSRFTTAFGIDPASHVFVDPEIDAQLPKLTIDGHILFDETAPDKYGSPRRSLKQGKPFFGFSGDTRLRVVGLLRLGPSFGGESTLIMSLKTLDQIMPVQSGRLSLGLLDFKPGVDIAKGIAGVNASLPADVQLVSREDFIELEKRYWHNKPIGAFFMFGAFMGLWIGVVMIYQMLSTNVTNNISFYALLISIGYKRTQLEQIVFVEGLILSAFSLPFALMVSQGLCMIVSSISLIKVILPPTAIVMTFTLIVLGCSASSLFAILRLRDANPSDLFG